MSLGTLPAIYQIELTSACDLRCPMCLRTTEMQRQPSLVKWDLLYAMHARDEFAATEYIELQMAGEPTIHPQLALIIEWLHNIGVKVGLSTHGLSMHKRAIREALMTLDALTISVDSVDPELYAKMRVPGSLPQLVQNIALLLDDIEIAGKGPVIDLQVIKSPLIAGSGNLDALDEFVAENNYTGRVRTRVVEDSFMEMDGRMPIGTFPRPRTMCKRPFERVSITANGDVVSCCFIFDPHRGSSNWYGNLYEDSLAAIWQGERAEAMRLQHQLGVLKDSCKACYQWSDHDVHEGILHQINRARP